MRRTHRLAAALFPFTGVLIVLWLAVAPAQAQNPPVYPSPRLLTLSPPGGKAGSTVEVTIGGLDLEEAAELYFSHPSLKAARVPDPDPNKQGQFVANKFSVTIAPETPIGIHDVRVIGKYGISNPRAFVVGDLAEVAEKEPNNDAPQAQKVELNTTINGAVNPNTDVDYFSFTGKQGQRVLVVCQASSIDSRLDPQVQLFVSGNWHPIASNRRYHDRDAVLDAILPTDSEYLIRVVQHTHLVGGPEYLYRLSVTLAPWIDAAYPPVVEAGKPAEITLLGRNLPNAQPEPKALVDGRALDKVVVTVPPSGDPQTLSRLSYTGAVPPESAFLDGIEYRVKNAAGISNPVLLTFAQAPIVLDNEDNDSPDKAQIIALPCELCGRIEKLRDRDWYKFTGKANEVYTIEAFASRLGAPLDLYFELRRIDEKDPKNRPSLGEFDDMANTDVVHPIKFNNRTDDPRTRFVIPADGTYELLVTSREADLQAGPRHFYRLTIRKEKPDYRLVVVDHDDNDPSATILRQGSSQYIHVLCFRQDGFTGEVTVTVEGLPPGVNCPPQILGPNQKQTALVLSAVADAPAWAGEIKVKGTATIDNQPLVHEARAGCVIWSVPQQQEIPTRSRLARSLCLAVREKGPFTLDCEAKELAVPPGASVTTKVKINRLQPEIKVPIQLSPVAAPLAPNAQPQPQPQVIATLPADKGEVEVKLAVPNNVAPGVYNLVFRGTAQIPFNKDPKAAQKPNVNIAEVTPPIKLTVYNQVANLSLSEPKVEVKAGGEKELVVKVERLHGYAGEFKVSLVLPSGFQGVSAAEITIPANANEGKLVLKSPANAAAASNGDVKVKAVAVAAGVTLNHETRLEVAVVK